MTQRKSDERERREERLAAALKQNLRRRKAQARGRAGEEDVASDQAEPRAASEQGDKP
ncbi:MAG TPA: hypothetical protein VH397_16315 [Xanthobacteraceae bacterium]|jgi:hypothetical protein